MFKRPTVFVVGAGASKEVSFPIGSELTRIIAAKLNIRFIDGYKIKSGDPKIVSAINFMTRSNGGDSNIYFEAGRVISSAMGQSISIDNFLHTHADDKVMTFMGKIGIAASILEAEGGSNLSASDDWQQTPDLSRSENTWYNTLFKMLSEDLQKNDVGNIFENISIITFNYDRCIEHYLAAEIQNYYRITLESARKIVSTLRIFHPYGKVGNLPWLSNSKCIEYGKKFEYNELLEAASQIRTFTERIEEEDTIEIIRALIKTCDAIVYLGFSYGDMNLKLLTADSNDSKSIFGTALGISVPNTSSIKRDINRSLGRHSSNPVSLAHLTCNDLLNQWWRPIMRD